MSRGEHWKGGHSAHVGPRKISMGEQERWAPAAVHAAADVKGQSMRYAIATAAVMLVAAQFASARGEPPDAARPSPQPPANLNADRSAAKSTEELKKRVEEVGFKDVE